MTESQLSIAGFNFTTLMKRLEAATSRLEDLTVYRADTLRKSSQASSSAASAIQTANSRRGVNAEQMDVDEPAPQESELSESIKAFDEICTTVVREFVERSSRLSPATAQQAEALKKCFQETRRLLRISELVDKMDFASPQFQQLYQPVCEPVGTIGKIRETNKDLSINNHLAVVAEGALALGWVTIDLPGELITGFKDSAQFYANRVLKEFRDKDPDHVQWVQSFFKILEQLQSYVKKYHNKGLSWSSQGGKTVSEAEEIILQEQRSASDAKDESPGSTAFTSTAPPPPPPPPGSPPAPFAFDDDNRKTTDGQTGGMSAVFQNLNKGVDITASLKKVDDSQKVHKNPALRSQAPAIPKKPSSLSKRKSSAGSKDAVRKKSPPRKQLEGSKWFVENWENSHEIEIEGEISQGVFINNCQNCTVQVRGKLSALTINNCGKIGVMTENLVSGIEINSSHSFGLQVTGFVPTIAIDQSKDGQIYLSESSVAADIYTAQTSGININIPNSDVDGDYKEVAVPEQLIHKISPDGSIKTSTVQHAD